MARVAPTRRTALAVLSLAPLCAPLCRAGGAAAAGGSGVVADPLDRPALTRRAPERAALLDVATAGRRLVAVGERGVILLSDDGGRHWRQAPSPVSVTLTAVQFPNAAQGWAVGHAGVVLRSDDGGESWWRMLDGRAAAVLALEAARRAEGPEADRLVHAAERLVADGPDKPFLTLHFTSGTTGFVAGAFGLIFRTTDGGRNWTPWMDRVPNPDGLHLYAMRGKGPTLYLAGEQGLLLESGDGGEHFAPLALPYEGTLFSLAVGRDGTLAVGGLRGNLFRADPDNAPGSSPGGGPGGGWKRVDPLPEAAINGLRWLDDGRLLAVTQAGRLFTIPADGGSPVPLAGPPSPPLSGLAPTDGGLVTVGMGGAARIDTATEIVRAAPAAKGAMP